MKEFYNENADFKGYVDRYCKKHKVTVDEALAHEIVKQVYLQYAEGCLECDVKTPYTC